jgi:hypothetical protein
MKPTKISSIPYKKPPQTHHLWTLVNRARWWEKGSGSGIIDEDSPEREKNLALERTLQGQKIKGII